MGPLSMSVRSHLLALCPIDQDTNSFSTSSRFVTAFVLHVIVSYLQRFEPTRTVFLALSPTHGKSVEQYKVQ